MRLYTIIVAISVVLGLAHGFRMEIFRSLIVPVVAAALDRHCWRCDEDRNHWNEVCKIDPTGFTEKQVINALGVPTQRRKHGTRNLEAWTYKLPVGTKLEEFGLLFEKGRCVWFQTEVHGYHFH